MTGIEIVLAVVLGLVVNEFTDVAPWLARKMVIWSAKVRYAGTSREHLRPEELHALIDERPGKLSKLGTGVRFASAALVVRLRRFVARDRGPDEIGPEEMLSLPRQVLPLEDEPSTLVRRYLFPTERYRGEWKRHWVHLAKSYFVITGYAVLGIWVTVLRIKPQYHAWFIVGILAGAVLLAGYRLLGWHLNRFVITNKRLMSTEGVLLRTVAMLPLLRVTDLRYVQTPLGRVLSYGTFKLESAGRGAALRKIVDLPNPNELYLRLVEEMYEPEAVEARLGRAVDDLEDLDYDHLPADLGTGADWPGPEDTFPVDGSADDPLTMPPDTRPPLVYRSRPHRLPRPDPAEVRREILDHIGRLSGQLSRLSVALERLPVPAADERHPPLPADPPDRPAEEYPADDAAAPVPRNPADRFVAQAEPAPAAEPLAKDGAPGPRPDLLRPAPGDW